MTKTQICPAVSIVLGAICSAFWLTLASAREKTDMVVLRNGDRITGEVRKLEYGLLELSTDQLGTIYIEWTAIESVQSAMSFDIQRIGGLRHFGTLAPSGEAQTLLVDDGRQAQTVPMEAVTRLSGLESGFFARIDGSLSVGFNYTNSTDISTGNMNLTTTYRGERLRSTLDISAGRTSSPESGVTQQGSVATAVQFLNDTPTYWAALGAIERNESLGIDKRLQGGAARAWELYQAGDSEFTGLVGVVYNREWSTDDEEDQGSVEGLIGAQWRIYRFQNPEVSLSSSAALYPSLTQSGRYRGSLNVTLRRELASDLVFDLSLYESYDSDPPDELALTTDYGIVTSIGYKF